MFDISPFRYRGLVPRTENLWSQMMDMHFRVDIKENDNSYILQAELPGVNKDNINIDVNGEYLTISINDDHARSEESENYVLRERRVSSAQRTFHIGAIKEEEIQAKILKWHFRSDLPKKEPGSVSRRRIDIQ